MDFKDYINEQKRKDETTEEFFIRTEEEQIDYYEQLLKYTKKEHLRKKQRIELEWWKKINNESYKD